MYCSACGTGLADGQQSCPECGVEQFRVTGRDDASRTTRLASVFRFEPGQRFADRYTIVEEIGAGGQAHVFKVIDVQSRRTVALKLMSPSLGGDSLRVERFKRELTLAQRVSHTNVCRVHDIGESDRFYYISMEYIDGQTLKDWAQAVGHLSPRQTVSVGSQICAGLEAIHAEAIIHRDLKPHNIMLDRSGRIVVMDFGLAYPLDAEPITAAGAALGTLAYMSPEQTVGEKADIRSDIYALGVILYEMLTGRRPPGDGENLPLALRRTGERCPVPSEWTPGVPEALDVVVIRCLEREPSRRPQSAAEVGARLLENWSTKVHRKASTLETSRRCSWKRRFDPTTACK